MKIFVRAIYFCRRPHVKVWVYMNNKNVWLGFIRYFGSVKVLVIYWSFWSWLCTTSQCFSFPMVYGLVWNQIPLVVGIMDRSAKQNKRPQSIGRSTCERKACLFMQVEGIRYFQCKNNRGIMLRLVCHRIVVMISTIQLLFLNYMKQL